MCAIELKHHWPSKCAADAIIEHGFHASDGAGTKPVGVYPVI